MTLQSAWPLLLLIPLLAWCGWEWQHSPRRLGLLLKTLALAAVCLALARPQWNIRETYSAVAVLSDASESIPDEQRGQQESYVRRARAASGGHVLRELEFGAFPLRELREPSAGRSTNLEAAIRNALSALPSDRIPRLVVLSDGLANEGAVERAVYQAWDRHVPVDTVTLAGRPDPRLSIGSVRFPREAFVGEQFPVEFEVENPESGEATLELRAEGRPIGSQAVQLPAGTSTVTARARIELPGATLVEGILSAEDGSEARFAGAVSIRQPRALLITSDTAEENAPLESVMQATGFELVRARASATLMADDQAGYDIVACSNEDFEAWPASLKERLGAFVREGGGFLFIAGERNLYRERTEGRDALPGHAAGGAGAAEDARGDGRRPRRRQVLFDGGQEDAAGEAVRARRRGEPAFHRQRGRAGLRQFVRVGRPPAAQRIPLRNPAADRRNRRRRRHTDRAGTGRGLPDHQAAGGRVQAHPAAHGTGFRRKATVSRWRGEAAANEVTISTIGLGQDVNRSYLERVARSAEGQSYFLIDISALEQIVLKDVMEHTGTSVTEREFRADSRR